MFWNWIYSYLYNEDCSVNIANWGYRHAVYLYEREALIFEFLLRLFSVNCHSPKTNINKLYTYIYLFISIFLKGTFNKFPALCQ